MKQLQVEYVGESSQSIFCNITILYRSWTGVKKKKDSVFLSKCKYQKYDSHCRSSNDGKLYIDGGALRERVIYEYEKQIKL